MELREVVEKHFSQGLINSAILLAEQIISSKDVKFQDYIQLAKGYLYQGDYRRSLTLLEQYNLLSMNQIESIINSICNYNEIIHNDDITITISAFSLAGQCLFQLGQYDDCINLLYPLVSYEDENVMISYNNFFKESYPNEINLFGNICSIIGKCYDMIDNRIDSIKYLILSLKLDISCTESIDYLISRSLLTNEEKIELYHQLDIKKDYLDQYYRSLLNIDTLSNKVDNETAISLSKKAENYYDISQTEMAYIFSRQAINIDPFYTNGLLIYIASAVELNLKTELYYLGHELSKSSPKSAISWYAIGCYYYTCKKYELSQKFLMKSTKMNKRLVNSWIALGHCLSAQEETEHAISAYRTAMKLAPGDYKPLYFMARELARSNNYNLAMHLLVTSSGKSPNNALILNEIGVIIMRLDRVKEAINYFENACNIITSISNNNTNDSNAYIPNKSMNYSTKSFSFEIYNNYGVALRRDGKYDKALECFNISLSYQPNDSDVHANIAFTYHLARRFDDAIASYHNAIALKPQFTFALELLQKAMNDKYLYESSN